MRVLIFDDDKNYGALVASACKKLGYVAQLHLSSATLLAALGEPEASILLVDLEQPDHDGLRLVRWLAEKGHELPFGFCTGRCQDAQLIAAAGEMGPVLPRVWTHADLKLIIESLVTEHWRKQAQLPGALKGAPQDNWPRGTGPISTTRPDMNKPADDGEVSVQTERLAEPLRARGLAVGAERVPLRCATWPMVRRICEEMGTGLRRILVPADVGLAIGEDLVVALELPDEMVVSINGRVQASRAALELHQRCYTVELSGFGPEKISHLLELCERAERNVLTGDTWTDGPSRTAAVTEPSEKPASASPDGEPRISWAKPPR